MEELNNFFIVATSETDRTHLNTAKKLQEQLRFYTEYTQQIDSNLESYLKDSLGEKYTRYIQFLQNEMPLICSDALLEYRKVFNKVNIEITNGQKDISAIRQQCNDKYYIENIVHEALMSAPNSLTIIELDISKIFTLDIANVLDIEIAREYESSNQRYAVTKIVYEIDGQVFGIDKFNYYKLESYENEKESEQHEYKVIESLPHDLGYCPAFFNFEKSLIYDSYLLRTTPFLSALPIYIPFVEHQTGRMYLESYGKYPIIKKRKTTCEYQSGMSKCNGHGQLMYIDESGAWKQSNNACPNTNAHTSFIGAGTILQVPIPNEGETDLWNSIEIVSPNIESLRFNKDRTDELVSNLSYYLVGGSAKNNMALNELQTQSLFERKKSILSSISDNYERLHYNILKTVLTLKFGVYDTQKGYKVLPITISLSVSYAKEFYLQTVESLYKELELAKNSGMPTVYLNRIVKEIMQVKYANSYNQFDAVLSTLPENTPLYFNINEIALLVEKGIITKEFAQTLIGLPIEQIDTQNQTQF